MENKTVELGGLKPGDRFLMGGVVNMVICPDVGWHVVIEAKGWPGTRRSVPAATPVTPLPPLKKEPECDLSLLRPIDASKLQPGDKLVHFQGEREVTYLNGPDAFGYISVKDENKRLRLRYAKWYCMKPLAWVEGRPVYLGDVLYHEGVAVQALKHVDNVGWMTCADGCHRDTKKMKWDRPKVKKEAWINFYGVRGLPPRQHNTKEQADESAGSNRVACVRVEWEE